MADPTYPGSAAALRVAMIAPPWFELPPTGYGGIEALVADLVARLTRTGHEVTLVGAGRERTPAARFIPVFDEPPSDRLGTPIPEVLHAAEAEAALRELQVDLVHDHTLAGPLLAGGRSVPTVATMHGPLDGELGDYYAALGDSIQLVAISDAQRSQRPDLNWTGTVHNGIDVESYPFRSDKDEYVLWLGRFSPDKGAHLAIDVAAAAGRPLLLAGKLTEQAERDYFEREVEPRLGAGATYVGEADARRKRELLAGAQALVFPIQWEEPFGLVMAEALACGTPVVALRRGSVPEVVDDKVTGFVLDELADLPEALLAAASLDPAECRRQAAAKFDLAVMAAGYERLYRRIVGAARVDVASDGSGPDPGGRAAAPAQAGSPTRAEQPTPMITLPAATEVTVLNGASFCRSSRTGDIAADRAQGLFIMDTRVISTWELSLDDEPLTPLGVVDGEPYAATFLTRAAPRRGGQEPTVGVERRRTIGDGLREDLRVSNFGADPLGATLQLTVGSDFADVFSVKDGRPVAPGTVHRRSEGEELTLTVARDGRHRGVLVRGDGGEASRDTIRWNLTLAPHEEWRTTIEVLPSMGDGQDTASFAPVDRPDTSVPAERMRAWRASAPTVTCDDPLLQAALDRSIEDLGSLRIVDPAHPDLDVVAAGAPWFMALFGRDALITSWLTLPWDSSLARGTLHTLARLQGRRSDAHSEEEPGRILHETRLGLDVSRVPGSSAIYYGTVDATPLFVMLLGEAARWGMAEDEVAELLPAADRALSWVEDYGDLDGDGFVEYERKTDRGLQNQGWKDSHDSITFVDGRLARGPIALAEVQGYVYAAYLARARLAGQVGDTGTAERCVQRALELQTRFDEAFWLPDRGYYALALDGDKAPVDALASNQGHCLWSGIARAERAAGVVEHLLGPEMFTGWGIRTLATSMAAFNPISYHNGSVWPHDNAIIVQGLARYGYTDAAARVAGGLIEASGAYAGRLPELFCGFARDDVPAPLPYPTSCSPQAWASATPIGMVTALLGLEPDRAAGVQVLGRLPAEWGRLRLTGLTVRSHRVDVDTGRAA